MTKPDDTSSNNARASRKHVSNGTRGRGQQINTAPADPVPTPTAADGTPAPAGPKHESVRGDRSGTGGVKKAKLTEEELTARMEAVKLKNAELEAAHARAEADEASFREREAQAAEKAKAERQNRQQMLGERERNRMRKLKAQGGREWDMDKDEQEQADTTKSQFRRGAYGGVVDRRQASEGAAQDDLQAGEHVASPRGGRGRGGRGRGRGGRGGVDGAAGSTTRKEQTVPTAEDFPVLKTNVKDLKEKETGSMLKNGGSWADEMDSPLTPVAGAQS